MGLSKLRLQLGNLKILCTWSTVSLTTLDEYDVKCTFFVVGEWAKKYPQSVKLIAEHGHELANHSYAHDHYSKWSKAQILSDIEKCDTLIADIVGQKPMLFRAAYGEYNDTVVNVCDESRRYYIQWSVDSLDYKAKTPADIYNRVIPKAAAGDIILMHTGTENTAKALPRILSELTRKYSLCPVSELIHKDNYIINSEGKQIKS